MDTIISGVRSQWNVANSLTAFRAVSVLIALPLLYLDMTTALFALVVIAALSDGEGYWARLTGTTTHLGRVFDPIADKLFVNTMLVAYVFTYGGVLILCLLLINFLYDIDNTSRRIRDIVDAVQDRAAARESTPTTLLSKGKTCILYGLIILLFMPQAWGIRMEFMLQCCGMAALMLVLASWWHNRRTSITSLFQ